jgi:ABC-type antimicrobial peptide transport system permease subunit
MMGKGSAIGKRITFNWGGSVKVIGVVADFVYGDMYGSPDPVMFTYDSSEFKTLYIRYKAGVTPDAALGKIAAVMKKDNPAYPFAYSFVDEEFDKLFTSETLVGQLSRLFACLAILISCLGLFGLSAYTAERRTKEIGIRKVLGASVSGITGLLSREFLGLVFLSTLIAFPIAWLTMSHWLQQYHYRISVQWWVLVAAGFMAVAIALMTVSFQCVKAALMNPVRSLRSE